MLGHLAPAYRCACSVRCFAGAVSWATWLLFTGVPARCVVLPMRCPGPLGSCAAVCPLGVLCCVCGVLGHLAPVHQCARLVRCFAGAVSWATWFLFTGGPTQCVELCVRRPGLFGSCSLVCLRGLLCCVCGVLGHLVPVHRGARLVRCLASAVSWATWLLFTGEPTLFVVLRVRCPGPLGSCSPVCALRPLLCLCGVLDHLAPVHRCARLACCAACAVSWTIWPLFTSVRAPSFALLLHCHGLLGSCSPVCRPGLLCCVCAVLGHLAPVHRCARSLCCFACAVSWATWLLFTGVPARCSVLPMRCPGPLGSGSPTCPLRPLLCLCGVLGHLAPVHRRACSVRCVARAVSWDTWLLFTGVPALCAVLRVRRPGPLGSCSSVCLLGVLCCGLRDRRCVCGASLRDAHPSISTAALRSRHRLGTLRARTLSSGWRLFRSWQGLDTLRARTRPSGSCSVAGRGWVRFWVHTRLSGRRLVLLGSCCSSVVRCLLCPLSGFAAPGGRCCLAPVLVPWLWPAACLSGVPCGRAPSGPVALGAPVRFPDALVPFPTPGACSSGFIGWLRGAHGGRPGTGLIVPAAGPRRGGGAGLAPRRTRLGPRNGVVPGEPLRRWSWAVCAAVAGVCGPGH